MRILGHDAAPPRDALEIPNTADVNTVAGGLATAPAVVL
jgi:hypothetical protein